MEIDAEDFFLVRGAHVYLRPDALEFLGGTGYEDLGAHFQANVRAMHQMGMLPIHIALTLLQERKYVHLALAEELELHAQRIDAGHTGPLSSAPPELREAAGRRANERMRDAELPSDGVVFARFQGLLLWEDVRASFDSVNRQCLVLCWSAFENLARDVVARMLNADPRRVLAVVRDAGVELRSVRLDDLALYDFSLTGRMGDYFVEKVTLLNFGVLKRVLTALLPDAGELGRALSTPDLFALAQKRHLIAHRCGRVDEEFVRHCPTQPVGEMLHVTAGDVRRSICLVHEAGSVLLRAVVDS